MSLWSRIIQRLKRDFFRFNFNREIRLILDTPPLKQGVLEFTLLSQVHKRDVLPYLLAVNSFTRFANPQQIVMVCDPSIEADDKALISKHIPHITFRHADEFTHADIPRGGTWERLYAISEYAQSSYVIQLDADTVTTAPVPWVLEAIQNKDGFVLGEVSNQSLLSLATTSNNARPHLTETAHVQTLSEATMDQLGLPEDRLYVRGCSGFTGFPIYPEMRERLLDFSRRMTSKLNKNWVRWGTEQVTSNYLVANAQRTKVLPFPDYATPDVLQAQTCFLHFIGSMRFINSQYQRTARLTIQQLLAAQA
ncbi:MAG TPA: hypothetical protein VL381_02055 [Rhodocyclaceae bacterium]|nr:hypothetical protein [Rhodocyclaceae bacterium]